MFARKSHLTIAPRIFLLSAHIFLVVVAQIRDKNAFKSEYIIGGWNIGSAEDFLQQYSPLLASYLTQTVGSMYSPPLTFKIFPVDYAPETVARKMIDSGFVDFIYSHPAQLACIEASNDFTTIATQRDWILERATGSYGAIAFALKSNLAISSIRDLRGRTIGVSNILASAGFQLPWKLLSDNNVDMFSDVKQVVFYQSDYTRIAMGVLNGEIDVGFVQSGYLESRMRDKMGEFKFLDVINASFEGELYPYLLSTGLVPQYGLAAGPSVPWILRGQILDALMKLNHSDFPAASASISTFTVPASLHIPRQNALDLGVMYRKGASFECLDQFTAIYDLNLCRAGYTWGSHDSVSRGCKSLGIPCPPNLSCVCRPCTENKAASIQYMGLAADESVMCAKLTEWGAVSLASEATYLVRDQARRNATYELHLEGEIILRGSCIPAGDAVCTIRFTLSVKGYYLLAVFLNGIQADFSPVQISATVRYCGNDSWTMGASLPISDSNGACICPATSYLVGKSCVLGVVLFPAIFCPALMLAGAAYFALRHYWAWLGDLAWKLARDELEIENPPEILVAVKQIFSEQKQDSNNFMFPELIPRPHSSSASLALPQNVLSKLSAERRKSTASVKTKISLSLLFPHTRVADLFVSEREKIRRDFVAEIRTLSRLRHQNVISMMGAVVDRRGEIMLVMELMKMGSLWDLLRNQTMLLEEAMVLKMLRGVVHGMSFLHSARPPIIHCDLKASNVLVSEDFTAKISDLGLSQRNKGSIQGTPFWMAPECLIGAPNSLSSDVYSFGIVLYEVMARDEPYQSECADEVLYKIVEGSKRPPIPDGCSFKVKSIMTECWAHDSEKRPSFQELERRFDGLETEDAVSTAWIKSLRVDNGLQMKRVINTCFPPHIADAIIRGEKVPPEHLEMVSIFFSDIVGFTSLSSCLGAPKVSDMLDRLYMQFDQLAERHGIFKIETIGDAYLCAANLSQNQQNSHAASLAHFAMDALKAAQTTPVDLENPLKGFINIRVGLCSGPVTASVVGNTQLKYTLFGDTVNTASRMESTSRPGLIQCSQSTAKLIEVQDPCIPLKLRGEVEIKGKGLMKTYWVDAFPGEDQDTEIFYPII